MTAETLNLPPVFDPVVLAAEEGDAASHARALGRAGTPEGAFVLAAREDNFDCAILLRPEDSLEDSVPVVLVAAMALSDALGAAASTYLITGLVWPGGVSVNGASVGGVSVDYDMPDGGGAPDWLAVSAFVRLRPEAGEEGGERLDTTCLQLEGQGEVTAAALAGAYARHFLSWMDLWEERGTEYAARHWLQRATASGADTVLMIRGELIAGTVQGLDGKGNLALDTSAGERTLQLVDAVGPAAQGDA